MKPYVNSLVLSLIIQTSVTNFKTSLMSETEIIYLYAFTATLLAPKLWFFLAKAMGQKAEV